VPLECELPRLKEPADPVCLITGGTSGVGLETASRFFRDGYRVFVCGRDRDRLESALRVIRRQTSPDKPGSEPHGHSVDLSQPGAAEQICSQVVKAFGRVDVLINNAAMAPLAPIDEISDKDIDATIGLNVSGVYRLTRAVWPAMKKQGQGIIINVSSLAAIDPFPGFSLYGATKAWIELLTIALAREGREWGIRTYCVRPGAVETPMLRGLFADFPADQAVSPKSVADLIAACCLPEMAGSSGQAIGISRQ
jgi:NAD(P)-dependent dehydrogenase (short-subunit alcohol dehydrogenase family)